MKFQIKRLAAAGLCAVLLGTAFLQQCEIASLRESVRSMQNSVTANAGATGKQTRVLPKEAPAEQEDGAPLSVRFQNARIQPETRLLSVDLTVEFPAEDLRSHHVGLCLEGEPYALAWYVTFLNWMDDGTYCQTLTVPLEPDMGLDLRLEDDTVLFSGSVRMLLPLRRSYGGCSWHYDAVQQCFSCCDLAVGLTDLDGREAQVRDGAFCLYRNGVLAFRGHEVEGDFRLVSGDTLFDSISVPCEPGDRIRIDYTCRDEAGLIWTFPIQELEALSWDDMRRCPLSGLPAIEWPE